MGVDEKGAVTARSIAINVSRSSQTTLSAVTAAAHKN